MPGRNLEQILRMLRDGQWHDINEVARRTQLSPLKMQLVTEFLAKYGFVRLDRKNSRIKISRHLAEFHHAISAFNAKKSSQVDKSAFKV